MPITHVQRVPHGRAFTVRCCAVATAATVALHGCADTPTAPDANQSAQVQSDWVTPEVLATVDPVTGQFRVLTRVGRFVSQGAADSIARAEDRLLGDPNLIGNIRSALQADRGAPIEFGQLTPCARVTYSVSPFGDFPPAVPGWARRSLGSHWAVPMCGRDGRAQLSVGVPDQPRDIQIVDGRLVFRQFGGGGDLDVAGVPDRFPVGLPLTPERAVAVVYEYIHTRINAVPEAYNQYDGRGAGNSALCASWRLRFEHPVTVIDDVTGNSLQVGELFVRRAPACYGGDIVLYAAPVAQPTSRWVFFPKDTTGLGSFNVVDSALVPLSGPTLFVRVRS